MITTLLTNTLFFYLILEFRNSNDHTLLHLATLEEKTENVQALLDMEGKTFDTTDVIIENQIFKHVTPLHIAILTKNPEILSIILQAVDNGTAMEIPCKNEKEDNLTSLQLGLWVARQSKNESARLVSNFT